MSKSRIAKRAARIVVYGGMFCASATLSIVYLRRCSPLALLAAVPAGHFCRMFYLNLKPDQDAP